MLNQCIDHEFPGNVFENYFVLIILHGYMNRFQTVKTQTSAAYLMKLPRSLITLNKQVVEFLFIASKGEAEARR